MNSLIPSDRWKKPVRWLAGLTTLVYTLSRFVPCSSPGHSSSFTLDESWVQTLHFGFAQHLQFGRDLVFTFGPWGFLCGGYYPATFLIFVTAWVALSFIFWWCLWQLSHHFWKRESVAWLWMIGCIGVAGLPVNQDFDVRLDTWALILLFLHFFVNDAAFSLAKILLVVSLGLLGLTKFTGLVMAAGIVLIIAMDDLLRQRRFPWMLAVFGFSVFFFWLAAGQNLNLFGPFLCNSWGISGGYTEAMMNSGEMGFWDAVVFWVVVVATCIPVGLAGFVKYRRFGALPLIGLGLVLFLTFKHGFVRHDQHESEAALMVLVTGLMGLAAAWPVLQGMGERARLTGGVLGIIVLTYASVVFSLCVPEKGLVARLVGTFNPRVVLSPAQLFYNANELKTAYENRLAEIREKFPLPELKGGVDVYSWDQVVVFAYGWRYVPRPVFQGYSAYTPELAEMNAAHLCRGRAADNLLFAVQTLDGRFASLDDGCSWPELLTRYDVQGVTKDFVLLKKSPTPREYHLVPLKDSLIRFAEPVTLPTTSGPIWVALEINKTPLGSLISTLYKPPGLTLAVSLRGGKQLSFRLIPGMARSGFLLSPLINDNAAYVALATGDGERNLTGAEVTSMTIFASTKSGSTACYSSTMRLRCYRLEYQPSEIKSGEAKPDRKAD